MHFERFLHIKTLMPILIHLSYPFQEIGSMGDRNPSLRKLRDGRSSRFNSLDSVTSIGLPSISENESLASIEDTKIRRNAYAFGKQEHKEMNPMEKLKNVLNRESLRSDKEKERVWEEQVVLRQVTNTLRRTTRPRMLPKQYVHVKTGGKETKVKVKTFFYPNTPRKMLWDMAIISLVVYTAIMLPFDVAFRQVEPTDFDTVIDVIFAIDVVVSFRTAYFDNHELITSSSKMASNYLQSWFWVNTFNKRLGLCNMVRR